MRSFLRITTRSPEETRIVGASLAPSLLPGDVVSLSGDLGAGKTVFVQGVAGALGVHGRVTSPTFTLVHEYDGKLPIVHLDVYRLDHFQEVLDLGFEELMQPEAILFVEWGDAVAPLLPARYLDVELRQPDGAPTTRLLTFRAHGAGWDSKLEAMRTTAETLLDAASAEEGVGGRVTFEPDPAPYHRRLPGPGAGPKSDAPAERGPHPDQEV
jgi:tRNA threonylcarbamoyladenosine biosynthesis protein TsaE